MRYSRSGSFELFRVWVEGSIQSPETHDVRMACFLRSQTPPAGYLNRHRVPLFLYASQLDWFQKPLVVPIQQIDGMSIHGAGLVNACPVSFLAKDGNRGQGH
jgi:hypothetical protein